MNNILYLSSVIIITLLAEYHDKSTLIRLFFDRIRFIFHLLTDEKLRACVKKEVSTSKGIHLSVRFSFLYGKLFLHPPEIIIQPYYTIFPEILPDLHLDDLERHEAGIVKPVL